MHKTMVLGLILGFAAACGGSGGSGGGSAAGAASAHSLEFSGAQQVRIAALVDFGTAFTIEAWVKPQSLTQAGSGPGIVSALPGVTLALTAAVPGRWRGEVCVPACGAAESAAGDVTLGAWQHLAMVYTSGSIALYRNGAPVAQQAHPGDPTAAPFLQIGRRGSQGFVGRIDEVRIWSVARTQPEIQASMSSILTGGEAGLERYWRFEEGGGQTVADTVAGGTAGTLGGTSAADADDPTWVADGAPVQ